MKSGHVLVTGAGSGLGESLASEFVKRGWQVSGIGRREESLAGVAERLGAAFEYAVADVRNADAVAAAVEALATRGQFTGVVNNAAHFKLAPFEETTVAELDSIVGTNLLGPMYVTRACLPHLCNGGRIVMIGSVAGTRGFPNQTAYCASKFGLAGFAEALAQEVAPRDIRVTTVSPGAIETPLWTSGDNPYPGLSGEMLQPSDVAELVAYVLGLPNRVVLKSVVMFPAIEWH